MRIIAFAGKRESGKTTAAKYLVEKYGATPVSFAAALREEIIQGLDYPASLIYAKPTPPEVRNLLIAHGTARRWVDPDYWVSKVLAHIGQATVYGTGMVVIDDLRYWNEAEKLRSYKATLVRVTKLGQRKFVPGVDDDPSECDLDTYDFDREIIVPEGGLDELFEAVEAVVRG